MGVWSANSKTHVSSMTKGDFYGSEKSVTVNQDCTVKIELVAKDGSVQVLKDQIKLLKDEVIDASVLSVNELLSFLEEQKASTKKEGLLFSVHLKATMMKISDPIIFGHVVKVYFKSLFEKHGKALAEAGFNPNNGFGSLYNAIENLPESEQKDILKEIETCYHDGPDLAMVNSDKGITNLHVPSDVIIDASMPAMIRTSGQMWNKDGKA